MEAIERDEIYNTIDKFGFDEQTMTALNIFMHSISCSLSEDNGKLHFKCELFPDLIDLFLDGETNLPEGEFFPLNSVISVNDDKITINGDISKFDNDKPRKEPFYITFTQAQGSVTKDKINVSVGNGAWLGLATACNDLVNRNATYIKLNDKEREFLPLAESLSALLYEGRCDCAYHYDFDSLIADLQPYGSKLPKLVKKLSECKQDKKGNELFNKIHILLRDKKYEPLWRKYVKMFNETQEEYQEFYVGNEEVSNVVAEKKSIVEQKLHALGYEGTYPDFKKQINVKGAHIKSNTEQTAIFGAGDYISFVHFDEVGYRDFVLFDVISGFVKTKSCPDSDAYSILFDDNSKRFFNTYQFEWDDNDIESVVELAAANAEVKAIDKKLMNKYYGSSKDATLNAIGMSFLSALFVTALFLLSLVVGAFIGAVIINDMSIFKYTLTETKWIPCGLICYFGWGIATSIVANFTLKNK